MNKRLFPFLIPAALGLLLLNTTALFAGAWTQETGKSYHRVAANCYLADREFDGDGDSRPMAWNGDFRDVNLSYYVEYGVMDTLTVMASLYYKDIRKDDDRYRRETSGVGDVEVGLRYRLFSGDIGVFSIQGVIKIPECYDADRALPLGNGQYDFEPRLMYGRSIWPILPGYMNLEAAYRRRAERPADEFRYLVEIGSNLGKNFYARAKLDGIIGMGNADDTTDAFGNPTSALEYDLAKLDLTVGYQMTQKAGIELGYNPAFWGETTAKGATWTIAFSYQPGR